ncbi:MAG: hypothetical protein AAB473_04955 [Patescibacteria group bacterium]
MNSSSLHRKEQLLHAAKLGGTRRNVLYGNLGTAEGRRRGGLVSAQKQRDTGKGITLPKKIRLPRNSSALAEFVGIVAGDGHLAEYQVAISTNSITDVDHAHFIGNLGQKLFGVIPKLTALKSRKVITIIFSSKEMVRILQLKGLIVGNKVQQHMRAPRWVMANPKYQIAFLRGVFDTDGGIFLDKHRIKHKLYAHLAWQFTSAIPEFLSDIAFILRQHGYRFSHSIQRVNILMRRASDIKRYFDEVGTHTAKHFSRFVGLKP